MVRRVTEDAPAVAQQDTPVAAPEEARQAVERADTGEAPAARSNPRLWKLRHNHPLLKQRQGEKSLLWNNRRRRRSESAC